MNMQSRVFAAALVAAALALGAGCASDKPMPGATVGNFMDDSYITSAVKTKLLADTGLKAFDIKVITEARVVTLKGTLPSAVLRDQAITVAKSVSGVKDVIADIEVKSN